MIEENGRRNHVVPTLHKGTMMMILVTIWSLNVLHARIVPYVTCEWRGAIHQCCQICDELKAKSDAHSKRNEVLFIYLHNTR
jgi:hypothetical protein